MYNVFDYLQDSGKVNVSLNIMQGIDSAYAENNVISDIEYFAVYVGR